MPTPVKTRRDFTSDLDADRSVKRASVEARKAKKDSIAGKKFSELSPPQKDKLLQLLGEHFGLIEEE